MGDDEKVFVWFRLVARDCKPTREEPRDDLFAAMPPLEAKTALFAFVAGAGEKQRRRGLAEVKLMFVNVKARFDARCDEREASCRTKSNDCLMRSKLCD